MTFPRVTLVCLLALAVAASGQAPHDEPERESVEIPAYSAAEAYAHRAGHAREPQTPPAPSTPPAAAPSAPAAAQVDPELLTMLVATLTSMSQNDDALSSNQQALGKGLDAAVAQIRTLEVQLAELTTLVQKQSEALTHLGYLAQQQAQHQQEILQQQREAPSSSSSSASSASLDAFAASLEEVRAQQRAILALIEERSRPRFDMAVAKEWLDWSMERVGAAAVLLRKVWEGIRSDFANWSKDAPTQTRQAAERAFEQGKALYSRLHASLSSWLVVQGAPAPTADRTALGALIAAALLSSLIVLYLAYILLYACCCYNERAAREKARAARKRFSPVPSTARAEQQQQARLRQRKPQTTATGAAAH